MTDRASIELRGKVWWGRWRACSGFPPLMPPLMEPLGTRSRDSIGHEGIDSKKAIVRILATGASTSGELVLIAFSRMPRRGGGKYSTAVIRPPCGTGGRRNPPSAGVARG